MVTIPHSRPLRHSALFLGLSALIHFVGVVALAVLAWEPWVPKLEVTWLDLDNRLGTPTPRKPAKATPSTSPPRAVVQPKRARPGRKKVATVVPVDAGVDAGSPYDAGIRPGPALADLAPGDAALVLTLRMDRIRRSPYEQSVRRLLEVFYDHKTLLWSSGLDPVQDFDALLIATPNPYRVTRTFLAVRHHLPRSRIRRALERSVRFNNKRMRWSRIGRVQRGAIPSPPRLPHDPRVVLLRDRLVLLTDPSHIPLLTTDLSSIVPRPGTTSPDAGARTGQSWLESLQRLEGSGGSQPQGPAMQLLGVNLPRLVRLPPDIPPPLSLHVVIPAVAPTEARGSLTFADEQTARRFLRVIPQRIARAKGSLLLRFLGVTDLLDGIRLSADKERVLASVKLSAPQVRSLLEMFRNMIPQVKVPGMPPRNPPDAGPAAVDASAVDAGVDVGVDRGPPSHDLGPQPH